MTISELARPVATASQRSARQPSRRSAIARRAPAVLGLVGAAVCAYGVLLSWLSTYNGLLTQTGWGTRNGTVLFAGAMLPAALSAALAVRPSATLRWLLALTGFVLSGFAGYLLIQLYGVFTQLDGMTFAAKGPGLYVATAGAATIFATIFLPMPGRPPASTGASWPLPLDAPTIGAPPAKTGHTRLFDRLGSRWRYPAAGLAVVAALAHVPVTPDHLHEAPYVGVLFIVLTVCCVLLGATLLILDSMAAWAALGAACLLAVLAYVVSRTVGLPMMADDVGNWLEPLGVVAILSEGGVVALALLAIGRASRRGAAQPHHTTRR
jgi:hypothetical protein